MSPKKLKFENINIIMIKYMKYKEDKSCTMHIGCFYH